MSTHTSLPQREIQRSLAAIVITDAVGFSRRMSQDEDAALALINQDLQLISDLCYQFEGRILKTTGDGALMYFISAVQAVACAIKIQNIFLTQDKKAPMSQHFVHRVGIHLGDIFFNNGDIMGSAVNITARLEAEAKPGAICMSQVVYEVVKSRLSLEACYAGELSLKNIEGYVAAYHVAPERPKTTEKLDLASEMTVPFIAPLNNALKSLSAHLESYKIKELLFTAQQGNTENNETILAGSSLKLLLESFTECNSTISKCQASLYQAASILGQAHEYFAAADIIIDNLQDFYRKYEGVPQIDIFGTVVPEVERPRGNLFGLEEPRLDLSGLEEPIMESQFTQQTPAEEPVYKNALAPPRLGGHESIKMIHIALANRLDRDANRVRIKKLLYCVCCHQWEKDCDRIDSIPMRSIIQELSKQVDTLRALQRRLKHIFTTYDLEVAFETIADQIISECGILYDNEKHANYQ